MGFSMGIVQMFYKLTYFLLFAVYMMRLFVGSAAMEPPYFTASRHTRRKAAIFNAFPSFAAEKARRAGLPQNYLSFVTFRLRNFFPAGAQQSKKDRSKRPTLCFYRFPAPFPPGRYETIVKIHWGIPCAAPGGGVINRRGTSGRRAGFRASSVIWDPCAAYGAGGRAGLRQSGRDPLLPQKRNGIPAAFRPRYLTKRSHAPSIISLIASSKRSPTSPFTNSVISSRRMTAQAVSRLVFSFTSAFSTSARMRSSSLL